MGICGWCGGSTPTTQIIWEYPFSLTSEQTPTLCTLQVQQLSFTCATHHPPRVWADQRGQGSWEWIAPWKGRERMDGPLESGGSSLEQTVLLVWIQEAPPFMKGKLWNNSMMKSLNVYQEVWGWQDVGAFYSSRRALSVLTSVVGIHSCKIAHWVGCCPILLSQ